MQKIQKKTLEKYMEEKKITVRSLADKIGCTAKTIMGWKKSRRKPHRFHIEIINQVTNGEVEI